MSIFDKLAEREQKVPGEEHKSLNIDLLHYVGTVSLARSNTSWLKKKYF